jgi:hypothetical protein
MSNITSTNFILDVIFPPNGGLMAFFSNVCSIRIESVTVMTVKQDA